MRNRSILTTALLAAFLAIQSPAMPAAAGDDDVRRSGSCSAKSDWKLKLSPEDRGLEVEFEVDQNVAGQDWRVTLKNDGERFFRGRRTTKGPSGSIEVRKVVDGTGGVVAKAVNLSSDEVCRGSASI